MQKIEKPNFKKINDTTWEISKDYKENMNVPSRIIATENILKQKENYYFDQFVKQYDLHKSLEKFTQFLNFISYKYKLDFDKLTKDLKEFTDEEKEKLYMTNLDDEFKTYVDNHEENLEQRKIPQCRQK